MIRFSIVAIFLILALASARAQVVIVDNGEAGFSTVGSWSSSSNTDRFGSSSLINSVGTGADTATWTPTLPTSGFHDVYATWTAATNRARGAAFVVNHKNGSASVPTNQEQGTRTWNYLGRYEFNSGTGGNVVLSDNAPGESGEFVAADAVRFERVTFATSNQPLVRVGSISSSNLCAVTPLIGNFEDHPVTKYFIVSDMPESFGYPSAGPVTESAGVLYSTDAIIPAQSTGYPPSPWNQQTANGFTTIDDDFDIFMFHIAQPGDGSKPRRLVVYALNNGSNSVSITPSQVMVTDGTIGTVHQMESDLAKNFAAGTYDNTGLGTVSIPAGQGAVIGFSKKFALIGTNTIYRSQNINCFGMLRGIVSGTSPNLKLHVVAIDTNSNNTAPVVSSIKTSVETILASATPGAPELESFQFDNAPTGGTLRRSTGVFPSKVWRSDLTFDLNTLPGGTTFQMGLDAVRTAGCAPQRQTVAALLYPPYLRGESIGNYQTDHRITIRVQNTGSVSRTFDLRFGRSDSADIGLMYQAATGATPPTDGTVDAVTPASQWAGGTQAANGGNNFESFLAAPLTIAAGAESYLALRFQILGNSSTPFQLVIPDTRGPEFDRIASAPPTATTGTVTALTYFSSEPVALNPATTVAGNTATFSSATNNNYTYGYTVGATEPAGATAIAVTANDSSSNSGASSSSTALTIDRGTEVTDWVILGD